MLAIVFFPMLSERKLFFSFTRVFQICFHKNKILEYRNPSLNSNGFSVNFLYGTLF